MSSTQYTWITGRQRTLTFSGTISIIGEASWEQSGYVYVKMDCTLLNGFNLTAFKTKMAKGSVEVLTPLGKIKASVEHSDPPNVYNPNVTFPTPTPMTMTLRLRWEPSNPFHAAHETTTIVSGARSTFSGTFSISAEVEQVVEAYTPGPSEPLAGTYLNRVKSYERVRQSTNIVCAATFGPLSLNRSNTVTNGPYGLDGSYEVYQLAKCESVHADGEAATTCSTIFAYGAPHSKSSSGDITSVRCPLVVVGSWSGSGSTETGAKASTSGGAVWTDQFFIGFGGVQVKYFWAYAQAELQQKADRQVQLQGSIYHFDQPRTEPCELRWFPKGNLAGPGANAGEVLTGPSYNASYTQRQYFARIYGASWSASERQPVVAYLFYPGGISPTGDDPTDTEITTPGLSYPAIKIKHEPDVTVFDGSTTSGWSGTNCTFSTSGGLVKLDTSAAGASATKTISPSYNSEGYRYARLYIRSIGASNLPFTIKIGSKEWERTTTGDGLWAVTTIDLCDPENFDDDHVDAQDTRYPIDGSGVPIAEGQLWGVNRIASVEFKGLSDSGDYEIQDFRLLRQGEATADFLPAKGPLVVYQDPPGSDSGVRGVAIDVDGRLSIEQYWKTNFGFGSVTNFDAYLDATPGFTGTIQSSGYAFIDSASEPVAYLGGGGWLYDSGAWASYLRKRVDNEPVINGQAQHHWIDYHHGCGDPFTGEGYGTNGPMVFRFRKILRGGAWGIVVKKSHVPYSGARVDLKEGASLAGQASANSAGFYATGLPAGKGEVAHDVKLESGTPPRISGSVTTHNRKRERVSFRKEPSEDVRSEPWLLATPWGHLHRTRIIEGNIHHARAEKGVPPWDLENQITSGGADSRPSTALTIAGGIVLVFSRGTGVYWCRSFDDGATFSTPALFMANRYFPITISGDDGQTIFMAFGYNSGTSGPGKIYVRAQGPGDTAPDTERAIVGTGGVLTFEPGVFGLTPVPSQPGRWVLSAVKQGETEPTEFENYDSVGYEWREI